MNRGHFDAIRITLASPEDVLKWSHGEVIKPETINYRTQRPEKDGLFSERIFGPTKDWECYCGKYRRARYKGVVCDKCGVEVTRSIVRRERLGHIMLAAPVAHIWFFKNVPSKIGLFLNIPLAKLERVIYYAAYVVTAVHEENRKRALQDLEKEFKARKKTIEGEGSTVEDLETAMEEIKDILEDLAIGNVLSESQYYNIAKRFGDVFEAGSGAEAIRKILSEVDLGKMIVEMEKSLEHLKDSLKESRILRRIKLAKSFMTNNMRPEWMIMTVLPVLPPDLRPMVALDGGRYATSDLNDLYRRVINRNNRLKKLMELKAPEVIVTNEKRMLQEAVDALIDNTARLGSQQLSSQRRPLRSLSDMLKGKQGRFRQNLLGKRVDYSGRSVIVVGPHLKLGECGLPKKMALELFKPFVIHKIIERGLAHNIRNSNRLIEQAPPEVWEILEEVIADRYVLLNRAPTLHRLGVQAFKPRLTEDLAIQIPPLVCTAFNADFDGDQMAVHLPLSHEAQEEARTLMLASLNLLKPATGDPIVSPALDIVLGVYYLMNSLESAKSKVSLFASQDDAIYAYECDLTPINAIIKIKEANGEELETTVGRILFNRVLPADFPYINHLLTKKDLSKIVGELITLYGIDIAREHLDAIKEIGFTYATKSGISWGMDDLRVPPEKKGILKEAEVAAEKVRNQYEEGFLTNAERRERIIEIWKKTNDKIGKEIVPRTLDKHSSVHSIIASGARGSWSQPAQMMGMKGLVQNNQGETIELPVKSSYKEGFNVLEYFISTHGSRKGLTDTALKTAQAGYLTRRLVDVSQDLIIREEDCKTREGVDALRSEGLEFGYAFANKIFSRTVVDDVKVGNKILAKGGEMIDRKTADIIDAEHKIESLKIRSPITCKTLYGVCSKCYGYDLGKNQPIKVGETVGVVAAQSIGEPGTQLTMRTFHIGGVAGADITHGLPRVEEVFEARAPKGKAFLAEADGVVVEIEEKGLIKYVRLQPEGKQKKLLEYPVPRSSWLNVKVGDIVKKGDHLSHGPADLREVFKLKGGREVERMILHEIQKIYLSEGAVINNKHIEIIVRQMFSRVKIVETGDTYFVRGDVVEKSVFLEVNRNAKKEGKSPAKAQQLLLGITKVALSTESFLSAASFMETARVLINASVEARMDKLRGLKENVIIGRLIPAGTGYLSKHHFDNEGVEHESETVAEAENVA
ncbi:MAG: DNA-directed RNA polymerase subunit beta' [Patescibacteria group bacterium]